MAKKIYLAGPDVFLENAIQIGKLKKQICKDFGFIGLFPMDNEASNAKSIFKANCALMDEADTGVFNLSPFRGPSADVGTVFELGYMFAKGKPVYGYSGVVENFLKRTENLFDLQADPLGFLRDEKGLSVENFDLSDNLMIHWAAGGGKIYTAPESPGPNQLAALNAFKLCLSSISE